MALHCFYGTRTGETIVSNPPVDYPVANLENQGSSYVGGSSGPAIGHPTAISIVSATDPSGQYAVGVTRTITIAPPGSSNTDLTDAGGDIGHTVGLVPSSPFDGKHYNGALLSGSAGWFGTIIRVTTNGPPSGVTVYLFVTVSYNTIDDITPSGPTPNAPSSLTAADVSCTHVHLAWQDNSGNEDGFTIERSEDSGTTWQLVATVVADQVTFDDYSVVPATIYEYRVRAFTNLGQISGDSNTATVNFCGGAGLPPDVLAVVRASGGTRGADPVKIIGYNFVTGATATMDGSAVTGIALVEPASVTLLSSTATNPTVITATAPHGLASGDRVTIAGHTSTPALNAGPYVVSRISATKFSVPVAVTGAGAGGTADVVPYLTGLTPAHAVGAVDVVVTNPDAQADTLAAGFVYTAFNSTPTVDAGQGGKPNGPAPSTVASGASVTRGENNGTITYAWSQVSGPASATITSPSALNTDFVFSSFVAGEYVFELTATTEDGLFTTSDRVTFNLTTVPPRVKSGITHVSI